MWLNMVSLISYVQINLQRDYNTINEPYRKVYLKKNDLHYKDIIIFLKDKKEGICDLNLRFLL